MSDHLEAKVEKLADAQAHLTRNVDRVTLMVEQGEKQRIEDKLVVKEIADVLKSLDKRMDSFDGIHSIVAQNKEDIRVMQHDWRDTDIKNKFPTLDKKVTILEEKIKTFELLKARYEGGAAVISTGVKAFWSFVGIGGLGLIYAILHFFFGVSIDVDTPKD